MWTSKLLATAAFASMWMSKFLATTASASAQLSITTADAFMDASTDVKHHGKIEAEQCHSVPWMSKWMDAQMHAWMHTQMSRHTRARVRDF